MDMIQVCCQSWFILAQADGENYAEIRGEMHDEIDGEADGEAYFQYISSRCSRRCSYFEQEAVKTAKIGFYKI